MTWRKPNSSQNHITAGKEAAISRGSCQARRTVSTNTWTVMKLWLTINGAASASSSRLPPGMCACGALRGVSGTGDSGGGCLNHLREVDFSPIPSAQFAPSGETGSCLSHKQM